VFSGLLLKLDLPVFQLDSEVQVVIFCRTLENVRNLAEFVDAETQLEPNEME